jgi:hypothetical protein
MTINRLKMTFGILLLILGCCSMLTGGVLIHHAKNQTPLPFKPVKDPQVSVEPNPLVPQEQTVGIQPPKAVSLNPILEKPTAPTTDAPDATPQQEPQVTNPLVNNPIPPKAVETVEVKKDTTDPNQQKGIEFEKYIVQKFSKHYFTLLDWTGDKFVKGYYAQSSLEPDLKMRFTLQQKSVDFAVECKYRSSFFNNGIDLEKRKLEQYQKFAAEKKMPVFIVLGVGGSPNEPQELFVIPLEQIETNVLDRTFLTAFKKANPKANFFFDAQTQILK